MKLKDLINPDLLLKMNRKGELIITEDLNKSKKDSLYQVTIQDIPNNVFAFSMDKKIEICKGHPKEKARNYYLNKPISSDANDKKEHKRINRNCDLVFIQISENNLEVYYCELKSGTLSAGDYEHQLINSKLLFDYILQMYNTFYGDKYGLKNVISYKFILFCNQNVFNLGKTIRPQIDSKMELYAKESIIRHPFFSHKNNFILYSAL